MIQRAAWRISDYLEKQGVETVIDQLGNSAWHNNDVESYHLRSLLQKIDNSFLQGMSLADFVGSVDEFRILRRALWPDSIFLRDDFASKRVELAWRMTETNDNTVEASVNVEKARHFLFYKGTAYSAIITDATMNLLIGHVEYAIGYAIFNGYAADRCVWAEFWLELTRAGLNRKYLHERPIQNHGVIQGLQCFTWISALLCGLRENAWPSWLKRGRQIWRIDSSINEAIRVYLRMLQTCGVDLTSPSGGKVLTQESCIWANGIESPFIETEEVTLYCMGITYGPKPEDWRFWIADDMESYAGDFWELVDPRPLWMPGGWIEEDSED